MGLMINQLIIHDWMIMMSINQMKLWQPSKFLICGAISKLGQQRQKFAWITKLTELLIVSSRQ